MARWLCIHLAGPMASFGEEAGNVQRGTADRPTRSALLGLAGAALGIRRDDADGQAALSASFSTSSLTLEPGELLTDFHTFEGVQQSKRFHRTRAAALAAGSRNTAITRREYRSGGRWLAAYRPKPSATLSLEYLQAAFGNPVFALWLGRKSCPPSHPLIPEIVEADDLETAFRLYRNQTALPLPGLEGKVVATDDRVNLAGGDRPVRRNRRTDQPESRRTWTFHTRDEFECVTGKGIDEVSGGAHG